MSKPFGRARLLRANHPSRTDLIARAVKGVVEPLEGRRLLAATLVADLDPHDHGSSLSRYADLNGTALFIADNKLYRSDGTAAGTQAVRPLRSVVGSSAPIVVNNGSAYYLDYDANGDYLNRTDGTAAGTSVVATLPRAGTSNNIYHPGALRAAAGRLYFTLGGSDLYSVDASTGQSLKLGSFDSGGANIVGYNGLGYFPGGSGLWRTDGTVAGTTLVKATGGSSVPAQLTVSNGLLYFSAANATSGIEPWRSDGTAAGTFLLKDILAGSSSFPRGFAAAGASTVFLAGYALWKTDGTTTTRVSNEISAGSNGDYTIVSTGAVAYLSAFQADQGEHLWRTDGTAAGTFALESMGSFSSGVHSLIAFGNRAYFTASNGARTDLYRTDGTVVGTLALTTAGGMEYVGSSIAAVGAKLLFTGFDAVHDAEPWVSDGTSAGTRMIQNLNALPYSSNPGGPVSGTFLQGFFVGETDTATIGNTTYFGTTDGSLWKSDGTAAGTLRIVDRYGRYGSDDPVRHLTAWNGKVYFTVYLNGNHQLWASDGTAAGTARIADGDFSWTRGSRMAAFGGALYVLADSSLIRTLGTAATTTTITSSLAYAGGLTATTDALYFFSGSTASLWRSDGTAAGTAPFAPLAASGPTELTAVGNLLFFVAGPSGASSYDGRALYRTDGTASGTLLLRDAAAPSTAGYSDSVPAFLTAMNGRVYYAGHDAEHGWELWQSNGTVAGTTIVRDAVAGADGIRPEFLTASGDRLYFLATTAAEGSEPWVSDGTAPGTRLLADIHAGVGSSLTPFPAGYAAAVDPFTAAAGSVAFVAADDGSGGRELWRVDGAAVTRVADVHPGAIGSDPRAIGLVTPPGTTTPTLLFAATDPTTGRELWSTAAAAATPPYSVGFDNSRVLEGATQTLFGYGKPGTGGDIVSWEWDYNYDGVTFDIDATGKSPSFGGPSLDGPGTRRVALRVTDASGLSTLAAQSLLIGSSAPTGTIGWRQDFGAGPLAARVSIDNASDASNADVAAGFRYSFDFNNDGDFADGGDVLDAVSSSAFFNYAAAGSYVVRARIVDKDGASSTFATPVTVGANPNIASLKNAYASGSASSSSPGGATDVYNAEWVAPAADDAWLYVDLGARYNIGTIAAYFGNGVPDSFRIQVGNPSVAPIAWQDVASFSGNTSSAKEVASNGVAAQYVRVLFTKRLNNWSYRIADLRVYGTAATGTTPGAPTAVGFNGPASVVEGSATTLAGFATPLATGQTIAKWEYDFDYDGQTFNVDATSQNPTFVAPDGPATRTVAVRATDNYGQTVTRAQQLTITNASPTATLDVVVRSGRLNSTIRLLNPVDPALADVAAGLRYSFDFNDDGDYVDAGDILNATSPAIDHYYGGNSNYTVRARVSDKDGGSTEYRQFFSVPAPVDLALGRPALASGTAGAGFEATRANDGDGTTWWKSDAGTQQWVRVDLGSTYALQTVALTLNNGVVNGQFLYGGKSFTLQVSQDGNAWTDARTVTNNTSSILELQGLTAVGRYVRVLLTERQTGVTSYEVRNFLVHGLPATGPTEPPASSFTVSNGFVYEGGQAVLQGSMKLAAGRTATKWEWDFDYDGSVFNADATGQTPTFSAATIDGYATRLVAVRVTDSAGAVGVNWQSVQIRDAGPTGTFTVVANANGSATASFSNVTDPAPADRAGGYTYSFDLNGDGDFADAGDLYKVAASSATVAFATGGTYTIRGAIHDKDAGYTNYAATVTVTVPPTTTPTKLTGSTIGTAGSFGNSGNTIAKALDGSLSTYVDLAGANGGWVGLDLGAAKAIASVRYAPRVGWAGRMVGGLFQASNVADFSSGVVTLATVTAKPAEGVLTTLAVTNATAFRYVRYLSPAGGYGNVAEVQFVGGATTTPANPPPATPAKLAGTTIGTAGSFGNAGNTIAKALDSSLSTYVDLAAANGGWVGLDLGAAKTITSVRYAPRVGWAGRMVGGLFQASTTADFSSGVVTLATVTAKPAEGVLTTLAVTNATAYRYVRYLSPGGGYGNVAEVEFLG